MVTSHIQSATAPALPQLCSINGCRLTAGHGGSHSTYPKEAWDFLSAKDKEKLDKAGYATPRGGKKGAYQNHVYRNNRVIVPYERLSDVDLAAFKDGYVIRLFPDQYFDGAGQVKPQLSAAGAQVQIGQNAFILYRSHDAFANLPPLPGWAIRTLTDSQGTPVSKRVRGCVDHGHYVLRLPPTNGNPARNEGAPQGIFAPEYADADTNYLCQALLAWLIVHALGSPHTEAVAQHLKAILQADGLLDEEAMSRRGVIKNGLTVCPLCTRGIRYTEIHETVSFDEVPGLENAGLQVEGATRSTVVNLFHVEPLLYSGLSHLPRNVAWGHATCNTKLGQRHCYSLTELIEQDLKVAVLKESGPESFGWISSDFEMIRSDNGSVWIRLVADAPSEQLAEELATVLGDADTSSVT